MPQEQRPTERVPPHNADAEKSVLGSMLRDNRVIPDLVQFLIKVGGAALAFVFILWNLPGGWGEFVAVGEAAGKFRLFETAWDPTVPYNLWAGVIGGAVFSMASSPPSMRRASGSCSSVLLLFFPSPMSAPSARRPKSLLSLR